MFWACPGESGIDGHTENPLSFNINSTLTVTAVFVPEVSFNLPSSGTSEGATSVPLAVELNWASSVQVTVDYAVVDGDAEGEDYILTSGQLVFDPGSTTPEPPGITLEIVNDDVLELDETVVVGLSNPVNAVLGSNPQHTFTIGDDDYPMVLWWEFEETIGTTAMDSSTYDHSLTLDASQTDLDVPGILNSGMQVISPGTPPAAAPVAYHTENGATALDFSASASLMTWFRLSSTGNNHTLLSKRDPLDATTGYEVVVNPVGNGGKGVMLRYGDGTAEVVKYSSQRDFAVDEWYHLALVFDPVSGEASFYVNGVWDSTQAVTLDVGFAANDSDFRIGADASNDNHLDGMLDEFILYQTALTLADIRTEFERVSHVLTATATGGSISISPDQEAYFHAETVTLAASADPDWNFTGWGGANAGDLVINGNVATLVMNSDKTITAEFERNPVADFSYSRTDLAVDFTDLSTTPDNAVIDTWQWDFGDGNSSTTQNPQHIYAASGCYDVTLTVSNSTGAGLDSVTQTLGVDTVPLALFDVRYVDAAETPYEIELMDASVPACEDALVEWYWVFEDASTGTGPGPHTRFLSAGSHTISMTVTQSNGETGTVEMVISVAQPPAADFTVSPISGTAPLDVVVTDASQPGAGVITQWSWDFGDASVATGPGPHFHTYADDSGSPYVISLTVHTQYGKSTKTENITVAPPPSSAPDVTPHSITGVASGDQFQGGDTISVGYTAENQSATVPFPAGRVDTLYLSLDDTPNEEDFILGSTTTAVALPGEGSETLALSLVTLEDIAPGPYYLIVMLDDGNGVPETDEANNHASIEITIVDPVMTH